MENIVTGVATNLAQRMVDRVKREAHYVCCFDSFVENFENERDRLSAKQKRVQKDIEDAKKRNENQVEDEVLLWQNGVGGLIQEDTKTRKKWFYGWCPDCIWQHRRGKELARKTMEIKELIDRCNFNRVARPAELPGMKYFSSSQDFIDFESRELVFNNLVEALKDENCYMIGLQGMGGAGKTTLAIEVGKNVEESKIFDKVIFVVMSNTPDFKMIQCELARQLDLPLEEGKERGHSEVLWTRIVNNEGKLLIILDDIWGEFNLIKDIGIPCGHNHNGYKVLITTRDSKVCKDMGCQRIIQLTTLTDEDALKLFLKHGNISGDASSSSNLKAMAVDIVKECGGLPVAIVAVASTLRNWPLRDWKEALRTLQSSEPLCDVHEDLTKVYKCLSLSYDNLSEHAKQFFLLCSLFPEDYEIPIELLNIIGIGVGLFGEVDKYSAIRSHVLGVKNELICSSLLLENDEECVKMHDLVREVALWITNKGIQAINDSKAALKKNLQYLFWKNDSLPSKFDCAKLEILLLEINIEGSLKVPETFFVEMKRLRVLLLRNTTWDYPTLSLSQSLQSLKDIRALILRDWKLDDFSFLGNLQSLEVLKLESCSIIELPKEIEELKKLRLLGLTTCRIGRNNPFEVIERCSQLEELYFVGNEDCLDWEPHDGTKNEDEVPEKRSPPVLEKYYLSDEDHEIVGTTSRLFYSKDLKHFISEAIFKYLVGRAEVLALEEIGETRWTNLIHDIALREDRGMNDLRKLFLYSLADIECLIDSSKHPYSIVTAFSKLIELHLCEVNVHELYRGSVASHFLEQLQILKLKKCTKLHNILFNGQFNLCNLKVMELEDCPMLTSFFQPYCVRSLVQLETLKIKNCSELKHIIMDESLEEEIVDDEDRKSNNPLFPKLRDLQITRCNKLELILPLLFAGDLPLLKVIIMSECVQLKYIFGECRDKDQVVQQNEERIMLPSLESMELSGAPSFINIFRESYKAMLSIPMQRASSVCISENKEEHPYPTSRAFPWSHVCCFLPTAKEANVVSNATIEDHTISPEIHTLKRIQTFYSAECLLRRPLNLQNTREMKLVNCSNLISLFSLSVATTMLLEKLTIRECHNLKHIISNNKREDHDSINYCSSIFPKLEKLEIKNCNMENLFPSTISGGLQKLKYMHIDDAPELRYVIGNHHHEDYSSNQTKNEELHIDLSAMETLRLINVPKIISIRSLEGQQNLETPTELHIVQCLWRQPILNLHNIRDMELVNCSNSVSLFSLSIATTIMLEKLTIRECHELKHIISNNKGEDHDHINYCSSIFPILESLEIKNCNKLEILFPSIISRGLQKLKYMHIEHAPELRYVIGNHHHEDYSLNQTKNDELHIDLSAVETLRLVNVPNIISICSHEGTPKALHSSTGGVPPINTDRLLGKPLKLHNVRVIGFWNFSNLTSLFTLAIASELTNLENLSIGECHNLKYIMADEEDAQDHVNYSSIFPNLKMLYVRDCVALVFLFPVHILGSLVHLKNLTRLSIIDAPEFNIHFDLPALQSLHLEAVPNLVSICWHQRQEDSTTTKASNIRMQNLMRHEVRNSEIEEIFSLKGFETKGPVVSSLKFLTLKNLSELRHICKGPKYIRLHNLKWLEVSACKKLRAIFSASTLRILPQLFWLEISDCEELVHIIEEDYEDSNFGYDDLDQPRFPNLETLIIRRCNSLKWLFSISTSGVFPKLECLKIEDACELEQVFIRQQGDAQKMVLRNVFQQLRFIALKKLPRLVTICEGIDFQTVRNREVVDCPEYQDSKSQGAIKNQLSVHSNTNQAMPQNMAQSDMGEANGRQGLAIQELASDSPNSIKELEVEKSTLLDQKMKLEETKIITEVPRETQIPFDDDSIKAIAKERVQEDPTMEDAMVATLSADLAPRNTSGGTLVTPLQEEFPLVVKKESKSETLVTHQQAPRETIAIESVPEDNSSMNAKLATSLTHSQRGASHLGLSTPVTQSINVTMAQCPQEKYARDDIITAIQTTDSDSMQQSTSSLVNLIEKESAKTVKEKRDISVEASLKLEKASEANLLTYSLRYTTDPSEDNVVFANAIPSSHYQSQIGVVDPSTSMGDIPPILGICEIFQSVELKDGEAALLAKAVEQYPQLRLPREQRTKPIIAFSYRVLVDILVILASKSPLTITASDKLTLEANLGAATFFGFDKDWIASVRANVFDIDMSQALVVEEEILVMEAELHTCDIALERLKKKRIEAKEQLVVAKRQLEISQSECESIDTQLMGLLEDRKKLVDKMAEFKKIISARDNPFGF